MTQTQHQPRPEYVAGLSLGAVGARTALAVLRRTEEAPGGAPGLWSYRVEKLHRWDLHTPYTAIAADMPELFPPAEPAESEGRTLAIDASVVGRTADLFRREPYTAGASVLILHVGAGVEVSEGRHGATNVPESHVAADALAAVESGRLTFAAGVPFAREVPQELRRFAARAGAGGRQRETDDLAVAVAIAVWVGENLIAGPWNPPAGSGRSRSVIANAPAGVFGAGSDDDDDEEMNQLRAADRAMGWNGDGGAGGGHSILDRPF